MWPSELGKTAWESGFADRVTRVDWRERIMIIPPTQWYHQHFNSGSEPARFINLAERPGAQELYPVSSNQLAGGNEGLIRLEQGSLGEAMPETSPLEISP